VDFEADVIKRVLGTIDSAVDFSLGRAIDARVLEISGAQQGPEYDFPTDEELGVSDLDEESEFKDAAERAEEVLGELEKTAVLDDDDLLSPCATAAGDTDMDTLLDPATGAKRIRERDEIANIANEALERLGSAAAADGILGNALREATNHHDEENQPPSKYRTPGTPRNHQADIRRYGSGQH
jgi:hypothetical protein